MTQRERTLSLGLLILVGGVGLGFPAYVFLWKPYHQAQQQINSMESEVDTQAKQLLEEKRKLKTIEQRSPRLKLWNELSLPVAKIPPTPELRKQGRTREQVLSTHLDRIHVDYERYLNGLLRSSGFSPPGDGKGLVTSRKPVEINRGPTNRLSRRKKESLYTRFLYDIQGTAQFREVTQFLEDFHRDPLMHKITSFKLQKARSSSSRSFGRRFGGGSSSATLKVTMRVEAIMIKNAKPRDSLFPDKEQVKGLRVLADPNRRYQDILSKNMFTGIPAPPSKLSESENEVLSAVKLTTLFYDGKQWKVYLYDQAKGGDEIKVVAGTLLDSDLEIKDKYGNLVLEATLVHADSEQAIFEKDDRYYSVRCGQFLDSAFYRPIRDRNELEKFGIFTSERNEETP